MKKIEKRLLLTVLISSLCCPLGLTAQGTEEIKLEKVKLDPSDQSSLQRGAKYFVNTCMGCHSVQYLRYNTMAKDIGITNDQGEVLTNLLKSSLMFNTDKPHSLMKTSLSAADGRKWFGVTPPDLTLEIRYRGADWVYTYLKSFYRDPSRPWGVNNLVFNGVGMPNVLEFLQGEQELNKTEQSENLSLADLKLVKAGALSPQEFDQVVTDIVNFLNYTADPSKQQRHHLGVWVLLFLAVLAVFAYLLKREYWKDVD